MNYLYEANNSVKNNSVYDKPGYNTLSNVSPDTFNILSSIYLILVGSAGMLLNSKALARLITATKV